MPNMTVVVPADGVEAAAATRAIADLSGPAYLRLSRAKEPTVYVNRCPFVIGLANIVREGSDIAFIACGPCVGYSLEAADLLSQDGFEARVIDMHTIKPLDVAAVVRSARETGVVLSVEEHTVVGGLGSAVAEALAEAGQAVRFRRLGLPDLFPTTGPYVELLALYGLDAIGIARAGHELLESPKPRAA